ncbi:hypothetical protein AB0B07_33195 [Streptomyces sioyaensis]|uniref:hypothetical protein n=1 Tax=Streptomyces sioyaensis TaxID=67364 RepID=UPI0033E5B49F
MKNDGTTPSKGGNGNRRARHQQRRDRWRQHREAAQQRLSRVREPLRRPLRQGRPMWQEPLRGALYAAGSGLVALAFVWFQSRM